MRGNFRHRRKYFMFCMTVKSFSYQLQLLVKVGGKEVFDVR